MTISARAVHVDEREQQRLQAHARHRVDRAQWLCITPCCMLMSRRRPC
ncbi:hypothetical protein [Burkholderia ubonensis]|nr:hypothetical protein [Burkholderia ubonensis]